MYYQAQVRLEIGAEARALEPDFLGMREDMDASRMILQTRELYRNYLEEIHKNNNPEKILNRLHETGSDKGKDKERNRSEFVAQVCAFIDDNYKSSELNVSMVADYFNVSISLLGYRFKEQMNVTISDYIADKKFAYACELLSETDYNVQDIAFMLGYTHRVSFTRQFKQQCGMTPVEYRMKLTNLETLEE